MDKVYILYSCDAWRSHASTRFQHPIIVAFSEKTFARMLLQDLELASKESEENQRLFDEIEKADDKYSDENLEKVLDFYNQQRVDYRIVYTFEEAYLPYQKESYPNDSMEELKMTELKGKIVVKSELTPEQDKLLQKLVDKLHSTSAS